MAVAHVRDSLLGLHVLTSIVAFEHMCVTLQAHWIGDALEVRAAERHTVSPICGAKRQSPIQKKLFSSSHDSKFGICCRPPAIHQISAAMPKIKKKGQ